MRGSIDVRQEERLVIRQSDEVNYNSIAIGLNQSAVKNVTVPNSDKPSRSTSRGKKANLSRFLGQNFFK